MSKFKVGDKVKQSAKWEASGLNPKTFTGAVVKYNPRFYDYRVHIGGAEGVWLFLEEELELAE